MSLQIVYAPSFLRQIKSLEKLLLEEAVEKIELLKNEDSHKFLKVHKLKGKMGGLYSFSVNYKFRIVFQYESKNAVDLLWIGTHDIYE